MMLYINIPAYNEGEAIEKLLLKIKKAMESRSYQYKVVVYNDGSTDNTMNVIERLSGELPLQLIDGKINQGLSFAMRELLQNTIKVADEEDIAVVLDGDNTHNPEQIFRMVDKIMEGFDVVVASRFREESRVVGVPWFRNLLSYGASVLLKLTFPMKGLKDYTSGYRAYRVNILRKAKSYYGDKLFEEEGFSCTVEVLLKLRRLGVLATEIPIMLRYDLKPGRSKMPVFSTILSTLLLMIRYRLSL